MLRSRIVVLEKVFEQPTDDETEKSRRGELLTYVTDLRSNEMLRATQYAQNYRGSVGVIESEVCAYPLYRSRSRQRRSLRAS